MKTIWLLLVLFDNDGVWREWRSFDRESECIEVAQTITRHRDDMTARCLAQIIDLK